MAEQAPELEDTTDVTDATDTSTDSTTDESTPPADAHARVATLSEGDAGGDAADSPGTDETATDPYDYFPETWRESLAGGDKARLNVLKRLKSPADLVNKFWNQEDRIRKGLPKIPDETSTEEEWAAYREEQGIPATPGDYKIDLPDGMEMDEAGKGYLEDLLTVSHKNNLPNSVTNELYVAMRNREVEEAQARTDRDLILASQSHRALKEAYGNDYRSNLNLFEHAFSTMKPEDAELVKNARALDGSPMMYQPGFVDMIVGLAREAFPEVTVIPNSDNPMQTVTDELATLKETMRDDRETWDKSPKMQERYQELLRIQERLSK